MTAPERIWASSVTENYGEWQTVTDGLPRPTEYVRADLCSALEAQLAERVKVKQMEWTYDSHTSQWWANSAIGQYRVWEIHGHAFFNIGSSPSHAGGKSIEEAKAAAQADYERRILSALEATPPAPKVTEADMEWLFEFRENWVNDGSRPNYQQMAKAYAAKMHPWDAAALIYEGRFEDALTVAQEEGR